LDVIYLICFRCITRILHQKLWGYKVKEKLYLGGREEKRLNTTVLNRKRIHNFWTIKIITSYNILHVSLFIAMGTSSLDEHLNQRWCLLYESNYPLYTLYLGYNIVLTENYFEGADSGGSDERYSYQVVPTQQTCSPDIWRRDYPVTWTKYTQIIPIIHERCRVVAHLNQ
jgi:hypothetical protein